MKKLHFLTSLFFLFSLTTFGQQVTITPAQFNVTDQITITVNLGTATCNQLGTNPTKVYMHSGIGNDVNAFGYSVVGNWGMDDSVGLMTNNGNGTWSKTITPSTYFNLNATQQANASKMGMVFRNTTGSQTLKMAPSCGDFIFNVGLFQVALNSPAANSSTIVNPGGSLNVAATNTNGVANYSLSANGTVIDTANDTSTYAFTHLNISSNQTYLLTITQNGSTQVKTFYVLVNPGTISAPLAAGMVEGINYNPSDPSRATLVLDAPFKDFVYVAGSFNGYNPDANYAMRKDSAPNSTIFFLELTNLVPGEINTYQYWVVTQTPVANSPGLVKTADPFSTLVLSPYDDPYIPANSYPNLPPYPVGQEREVTVLQTGQTPYNWQVQNFNKPKKEDLIVYEVLIRDFDSNRNFQDLINRIDYFKNLKINAIELMPVMEFEGNESWGYNTAYHMALDKFYGTENKFKEFVDLCHQNGIAVILDVALNHAFGRNPMVRMWMKDPDGDGFGDPTAQNPYFNEFATHAYGVGSDFNHSSPRTQQYVHRVLKHWIEDFKIDGFRWDLTKGFTQACNTGDEGCTNAFQLDRVNILKGYADYSWSLDPTDYVIFEHLGSDNEEKEWANYRLNETPSKGVMMWSEMTYQYSQLIEGYAQNATIDRIGHNAHAGFQGKRVMGYAESHDKERLMYNALTYGNSAGTSPLNNLNNALARMPAIAATSLMVPGPKMIWHFADLGMNISLYTCNNGTLNTESDPTPGDCKLDTKPQPQWTQDWLNVTARRQVYNDWARMIALKIGEPVFEGNYSISPDNNNIRQRIYVFDPSLGAPQISNVVILANFSVAAQNVTPDFPFLGTWYNLMDNSTINVTSTTAPINIPAGQFRMYGNRATTLNTDKFDLSESVSLVPNPTNSQFQVNIDTKSVEVYSITGQMIKKYEAGPASKSFDVSTFTNGIYMVKVIDNNNREKTMKLIKQ